MEKLTIQEEELMLAVWQVGPGFIKDYIDVMDAPQPPYTTVASTMKNLEKKGYLTVEKYSFANRYTPKIKQAEYKKRFMSGFVKDFFQSSYKELVASFAKDKKISREELNEIIALIDKSDK